MQRFQIFTSTMLYTTLFFAKRHGIYKIKNNLNIEPDILIDQTNVVVRVEVTKTSIRTIISATTD